MVYGYVRVSTQVSDTRANNQTFDRQLLILKNNGVEEENVICERISGTVATAKRPEFEKLLEKAVEGDTIIIAEMSRLARSLADLIFTVNDLVNRGIGIKFIKENISVSNSGMDAMSKMVFNIMGAFAEFERDIISDRTKQGLEAVRAGGKKLGRASVLSDEQKLELVEMYSRGDKLQVIADYFETNRQTINNYINSMELPKRNKKKSGEQVDE